MTRARLAALLLLAALAPARPDGAAAQDLFARIELSRPEAVVGQQVVAEVVLYFGADVQPRQTVLAGPWDAPGFWREELDVGTAYPRAAGGGLDAVTLRRVALFPTRDGRLALPPMAFTVEVVRTDGGGFDPNDPFGPFFSPFSARVAEERVEAPGVTLPVSPLPPGAPADFSGAVGTFALDGAPERTRAAAGEPVRLRWTLSGDGNVATLGPPVLPPVAGLDAGRPASEQTLERGGRRLRGTKTFTVPLVPQGGGRVDVPPATWTFFDPETRAYRTLTAPGFALDVDGAPAAGRAPAAPETAALAPLVREARWRRAPLPVGVWWGVLGAGLGLPALALGVAAVRTRRARRTPARAARRFDSPEAAARALDVALAAPALDPALAARARVLRDALEAAQFVPGAPAPAPEALAEAAAVVDALGARAGRAAAVLALALLLAAPAAAQTPEDAFALGLELAAAGDTLGALAAFEAADPARSAAAAHNAGTLALAAGDAPRARLHLERAARLDPLGAEIRQNLALARAPLGVDPPGPLGQAWALVRAAAGVGGLVALALALVFGALALGLRGQARAAWGVGALALVAVAGAGAALVGASRPAGVALADAEVRAAPSADAPAVGALRAGAAVGLGATEGAWRAVRLDGVRGFVPVRAVEAL